jgi:hypothetical protein
MDVKHALEPPGWEKTLAIIDSKIASQQRSVKALEKRCDFLMGQMDRQNTDVARSMYDASYADLLDATDVLGRYNIYREWAVLNQEKVSPSEFLE